MALKELIPGLSADTSVVVPGDADYDESIKRWSEAAVKRASIVVYAKSASDVASSIIYSKKQNLDLAIVCGGHASSGSSSTDGGLCIDLSKMCSVTVDPDLKLIYADGGCTWAEVDKEAAKYGLATVGGTVSHTGIGGLTLGGGYGFLNGVHGLVIDNLVSVEMVLADGSMVTASEKELPDLFWAIRGAGSSFGVVTKFVYRAHPQGSVWAATMVFPTTQLAEVVEAANQNFALKNGNSTVLLAIANPPPQHSPVILAILFFNGSESEARSQYAPFLKMDAIHKTEATMSYPEMNCLLNDSFDHGFRRSLKGSAFIPPLDVSLAQSFITNFEQFLEKFPNAQSSMVVFEFIPFEKIASVPQTATAFANRGAYGGILFAMGWTEEAIDDECRKWTRELSAKSREAFEKKRTEMAGELDDGVTKDGVGEYFNYDGLGISGQTAFGVNYPRLVELKKRFDPNNVFNKGPKLLGGEVA